MAPVNGLLASQGKSIVTDSLVLWLDGAMSQSYPGTGTAWTDITGNNNNGTLVNGTIFDSTRGGSISFDGVNDYVQIAETVNMTPSVLSFDIVFEVTSTVNTQYSNAPSTAQYVVARQNTRAQQFEGYVLVYQENTTNVYVATATSAGAQSVTTTTAGTIPLNTITNVTVTLDNSLTSIYINGAFSTSGAKAALNYHATNPLKLGRMVPTGTTYDSAFNGRIYSFKFYNKVLSAAEVSQNFNAIRGRFSL